MTFRHPLLRSAIYRTASAEERRSAHEALAAATDPELDPDRRAWHRAQATLAPDEEVAAELERSADRARARGGLAAAAAFLERAAALTPDPAQRAPARADGRRKRPTSPVRPRRLSSCWRRELGPLDELAARPPRAVARAARIRLETRAGRSPLLLNAARHLDPLDAELARETYLEALAAAIFAGRLGTGHGVREVAETARTAPPAAQPARTIDLLLDGLATRFAEGYAAGLPPLRRALDAVSQDDGCTEERWLWLACRVAPDLWDDETWHELAARQLQLARDAGALTVLPLAATYRAGVHVHAGEFAAAAALDRRS